MRIKPAQKTRETVKTSDGLFGFSKDFAWEGSQVEPSGFFADNVPFRAFFSAEEFFPPGRGRRFFLLPFRHCLPVSDFFFPSADSRCLLYRERQESRHNSLASRLIRAIFRLLHRSPGNRSRIRAGIKVSKRSIRASIDARYRVINWSTIRMQRRLLIMQRKFRDVPRMSISKVN